MVKIAVDNIKNWVFVTGAPRSGTTFVGKVMSLPLEVDYIHEPFNVGCGMKGMKRRYFYVRPSLDTEEMQQYHELVARIFRYDFELKTPSDPRESALRRKIKRIIGSRGPFYLRLAKMNPFHQAAVIKCPMGCFLAAYLYEQFGVRPVIVVKHPLSLAASLKRVGWHPSMHWFREQPALIEDYFSEERSFLDREWRTMAEAAAAHWRIMYKVMLSQAEKHPDWHVVTHEALCKAPVPIFQSLFTALDLPWSPRVERKIIRLTQRSGSAEAREGKVQDFNRKSADIFELRRESLSLEERRAIFEIVQDVALPLYSRESFAIDQALPMGA